MASLITLRISHWLLLLARLLLHHQDHIHGHWPRTTARASRLVSRRKEEAVIQAADSRRPRRWSARLY